MDAGIWTFRCRRCASGFELTLRERESAAAAAKLKRCPNCGHAPAAGRGSLPSESWHTIIGYRMEKNAHPFFI
ncbi:MAG TPA: hypothetical protein VGH50_08395 [Candidatus Binatia bacterium]|jgi:rRNA maturation endonuclease Nob1